MLQRNVPWGLLAEFVDPIWINLLPGFLEPPFFLRLWCFHQVVHVNVKVVIKLDEIDGGLGLHLVYDHASPFRAILFGVLHLLAHEAVHHLSGLALRGGRIVWKRERQNNVTCQEIADRLQGHSDFRVLRNAACDLPILSKLHTHLNRFERVREPS